MKIIPHNSYLRVLALGGIVSACVNSTFLLAEWWAVSPHGSSAGLWPTFLLIIPMLCAINTVPIALLVAIPRRLRKRALQTAAFAAIYFVVEIVLSLWADKVRMQAFAKLADRSTPLVDAIKQFETERGEPPSQLEELVPKYLPAIPSTGMGAFPEYEYLVGEVAEQYEGNPWILMVDTPSGGINFDKFIYFPKGYYPKHAYSWWRVERIGDWAYCYE